MIVALTTLAACKPQGPENKSTGSTSAASTAAATKTVNPGAVKLEFFVMSQCPFGVDVVNKVKDVVDKLGPDLDFSMDFIGTTDPQGNLGSMHGPEEVTGDIVELCGAKFAPAKYLDMVVCMNKNPRQVAANWEQCAKDAQLPVDQIKSCVTGPEGKQLLGESFKRSGARQAHGSPTMFLGGKPYGGMRSTKAFFKAACAEYTGNKPAACAAMPPAPPVNVTILTDKRCEKCAPERLVGFAKQRIDNAVVKQLDYTEPEGKALYEALGGNPNLPLMLFDNTLEADKDAMESFGRGLAPLGNFKSFNVRGQFSPACANEGGCKLAQCKETWTCRQETPKKLELFVMSQCPFGTRALDSMDEVLKAFDNKVDFQVHYIPGGNGPGLTSMHGPAEVDEDVREICAMKHYNKNFKWMEYVLCRNKDIRSTEWQKCATNGIDVKVIEKCFTGDEGKKLLEEDMKVATNLGIGASPSWVANGKHEMSPQQGAEGIKKAFCDMNKGEIKGCEKTLSGPPAGAAAPQGGCGK
jgi:hypothetical protein